MSKAVQEGRLRLILSLNAIVYVLCDMAGLTLTLSSPKNCCVYLLGVGYALLCSA